MTKDQLDALFAMLKAFPQERHDVDEHGVLRFTIPLTEQEHEFWKAAQTMMEPVK